MSYYDFLSLINQNINNQSDYKSLCRFCLERTSNGVDISSAYAEAFTLMDNYFTITKQYLPITPEHPNFICSTCEQRLSEITSFIHIIIENGKHWESYLENEKDVKFEEIKEIGGIYQEEYVDVSTIIKVENCETNFDNETNVSNAFNSSMAPDKLSTGHGNGLDASVKLRYDALQNDTKNINSRKRKKLRKEKTNFSQLISTEYERTCKFCDITTFISMQKFYNHQDKEHPGQKIFACDICGSNFTKKGPLYAHMRDRHANGGRTYQCLYCAKLFFTSAVLKDHEKSHLNARSYVCNLCGKSFNRKSILNVHMKSKAHNETTRTKKAYKIYKFNPSKKPVSELNQSQIKKVIRCNLCVPSRKFLSVEDRTIHRNLEHRKFECDVCRNTYITQESLHSHRSIHSDKPRPFVCTVCNASYDQSSRLSAHIKRKHTKNKSLQCSYCDKCFFERGELNSHVRLVHKKQKRVQCDVCSSDFATLKYLKSHMLRQHSGHISYDCKFCKKECPSATSLTVHLVRYHKNQI